MIRLLVLSLAVFGLPMALQAMPFDVGEAEYNALEPSPSMQQQRIEYYRRLSNGGDFTAQEVTLRGLVGESEHWIYADASGGSSASRVESNSDPPHQEASAEYDPRNSNISGLGPEHYGDLSTGGFSVGY